MNWLDEKEKLENYICIQKKSYEDIGREYGVTGAYIKKLAKKLNIPLEVRRIINPSETFGRKGNNAKCLYCGKEYKALSSSMGKYCSRECAFKHQAQKQIERWKTGIDSGTSAFTCASYVRNYMLRKHDYKCEKCGWGIENPYTYKIPLQIHHIDGNSLNNKESNLQVLCPNCHSLTENFGSRNKNTPKGKSKYYGKI